MHKGTSKYRYVSNPNRGGGLHNYGLAVDISIQDSLCLLYTSPSWLAEYINDAESYLNLNISYEQLMQLIDMGYMQELSPKRIAQILPGYICIRSSLPKGKDTFNLSLIHILYSGQ